ncbi:unnamed protein product [Echinostoma caproni]|uniref:Cilia-and flagella-associated protein 96 n=1 Tax=Echinostoma caproni TaxID=27848 RepID=A0A183B436_9TREM|nr:unnamed protein product [Echinostoma caproni]
MTQKTDLQRLGIFKELSYHTIGDPYVPFATTIKTNTSSNKGLAPMYLAGGYSKTKAANSDGYFHPFESAFIGDGGMTYADLQRQERKANKAKMIGGRDWIPASGHKNRSGVGSTIGNFQEVHTAMDPTTKVPQKVPVLKNFYTNPGKKGTGYGYPDVCMNPFPAWQAGDTGLGAARRIFEQARAEHATKLKGRAEFVSTCRSLDAFENNPWASGDPLAPGGPSNLKFGIAAFPKSMIIGPTFIPSSPAKHDGGMKAGTINRFPEYTNEPYVDPHHIGRRDKTKYVGGEWIPNRCTAVVVPQPSIVNKNTMLRINPRTRKTRQRVWDLC